MAKIRLGKDATITGGGFDNARVKEVTINFSKGEADVSTRGKEYRQTIGTLKECSVDAVVIIEQETDVDAVRAKFESGDPLALTFSDAGGALTEKFECMSLDVGQPLEDGIQLSITFKTTADEV